MADNKFGDLFDDLWGGLSSIQRKTAKTPESTAKKEPDTPDIQSILSDLEKNIQSDQPLFTAPKNHTRAEDAAAKDNPTKKEVSSTEQTEAAAQAESKPEEPDTDPMDDLNALVGLEDLKKDVAELISLVKMQKMRKDQGLKSVPVSLHLVFSGNPGTGKTTVARILARLYKNIGVLSKGQLVEVDRSALVAGFVGQTATKTQEKIQEAMGGILFIDEAYTLAKSGGNDFGQEAIDTLLKAMEDHRDDFVVIVAGYPDLMKKFINSNPGLESRFNKYLHFQDYTKEELIKIFDGFCTKYEYHLEEDARTAVLDAIGEMVEKKSDNFANAREVRNLFEKIITRQATRIGKLESATKEELTCISKIDVDPNAAEVHTESMPSSKTETDTDDTAQSETEITTNS